MDPRLTLPGTRDDPPVVRVVFVAVVSVLLGCAAYAAYHSRGLYLDGVYFLYRIAETSWFHVPAPPRQTVDLLRQAPVVLLDRYTDLSFARLGQSLSLAMAALPVLLVAACWVILPHGRKPWIVLPLCFLLIGVSPAAFMPHTEASLASAYVWVLLFLLLFRTQKTTSQALFLVLCVPAFWLAEALCLVMPVLLLACAARWRTAILRERIFLALASALIVAITIYQASWVIVPRVPEDVGLLTGGLRRWQFLIVEDHVNLPFVNGAIAFAALGAIAARLILHGTSPSRLIAFGLAAFAAAAIIVAFTVEKSFSPYAHYHARYFPVLITLVLGVVAVVLHAWAPNHRALLRNPAILSVVVCLCAMQAAADIAATGRWREYITDLQQRLDASSGLIPWESTLRTGDARRDTNWKLLDHGWLMPLTSIAWSRDGIVKSVIDWPANQAWRPLDTRAPEGWPKLPGVDIRPYAAALAAQRDAAKPK